MGSVKLSVVVGVMVASCVACALPKHAEAPSLQGKATQARKATVFVAVESDEEAWTGTGWYVYTDGSRSLVVTAGHVCEGGAAFEIEEFGGDTFPATLVVVSDEVDDTCVLSVAHKAPTTLSLGTSDDLGYGDSLIYVGYPAGQIAVVTGAYAGRDERPRLIMSVWGYFGASGSAVLGPDGKVVGMLVALNPRFPQTTFAVPVETVRGYVVQALTGL